MKTLLLGMGNPILADDAIGVRLAVDFRAALQTRSGVAAERRTSPAPNREWRRSAETPLRPQFDIMEECSVGGLNLLDLLRGYERVIVLDSLQTSGGTPGAWHRFTAAALRETVHLTNIHDANFATALELGRRLGLSLPDDAEIHVFAVEIQDNRTFSERMTPALEQAYPHLRAAVFRELRALLGDSAAAEATRITSPPGQSLLTPATALNAHRHPPKTTATVCVSTN